MSDLGARKAGNLGTSAGPEREPRFDERRKRILILRAGGGLVNPSLSLLEGRFTAPSGDLDPGARYATTASHTAGQPSRKHIYNSVPEAAMSIAERHSGRDEVARGGAHQSINGCKRRDDEEGVKRHVDSRIG